MLKNEASGWETFFGRYYWLFINGAPSKRRCQKVMASTVRLAPNDKIIEMGCGTGFFLRWFQKYGYNNLYGLDFAESLVERLQGSGIKPIHADFRHLDFDQHEFDLVFSDGVIEHFVDPLPILKSFARIARKYLITIIPRKTLVNAIETAIMRPPKEYGRPDDEWVRIHQQLGFNALNWYVLGQNCLMIVCQRDPIPSREQSTPDHSIDLTAMITRKNKNDSLPQPCASSL